MAEIQLPYMWRPRSYQMRLWRHMEGPEEGKRAACVWHRRAGKDLCGLNIAVCKAMERVGTYWHVLPTYKQGRAIVWNGFTKDGRTFLSHIPESIRSNTNNTEMRITLKNGSIYQVVGTDNVNSLVGTNPIGIIMSEYSLHDPAAWDYLRPILAENGGWALFIYTARGKNHGYKQIMMAAKNKKWFSEILKAGNDGTLKEDGTPVISDEVIQEERNSGMPEEMIEQEFYCSFEAPLVGAYYGTQMLWLDKQVGTLTEQEIFDGKKLESMRIANIPWDPHLDVVTWWDLGFDDSTTIWFLQEYRGEYRFIDYYENSGESLAHYAKVLKERPYAYGDHLAPHDINVHELTTGVTRLKAAKEMGIRFKAVGKHSVEDGIEAVRGFLMRCWFDKTKCERGIAALREYKKKWNEETKTFSNTPDHNWASHGSDAFRTGVMGTRNRPKKKEDKSRQAKDDYDYLKMRPMGGGEDDSI